MRRHDDGGDDDDDDDDADAPVGASALSLPECS